MKRNTEIEDIVYIKSPFDLSGCVAVINKLADGFKSLGYNMRILELPIKRPYTPFTYVRDATLSVLSESAKRVLNKIDRRNSLIICHPWTVLLPTSKGYRTMIWAHFDYFYFHRPSMFNYNPDTVYDKEAKATWLLLEYAKQLNKTYHHVFFDIQSEILKNWDTIKISGFAWDNKNKFPSKVMDLDERMYDVSIVTTLYKFPTKKLLNVVEKLSPLKIRIRIYSSSQKSRKNAEKVFSKFKNVEIDFNNDYEGYIEILKNSKIYLLASDSETYGIRFFEAAAYSPVVSITHYPYYNFDIKVDMSTIRNEVDKLLNDKEYWYRKLDKCREASRKEDFDTLLSDLKNMIDKLNIKQVERNVEFLSYL